MKTDEESMKDKVDDKTGDEYKVRYVGRGLCTLPAEHLGGHYVFAHGVDRSARRCLGATSIVVVAMTITTLTTLSLSAICTNGAIQAGGAYFLISRNLGPELGGAIGILFSLANATAVALHLIGFGETLFGLYNGSGDGIPYPPPPEYYRASYARAWYDLG